MNLIPNIPAKLFTLSAIIVGYLLIDDLTANEQNALGNWLMLTAQVLCTNAFYQQVEMERGRQENTYQAPTNEETLLMLQKMMNALQTEIENIKADIQNKKTTL